MNSTMLDHFISVQHRRILIVVLATLVEIVFKTFPIKIQKPNNYIVRLVCRDPTGTTSNVPEKYIPL